VISGTSADSPSSKAIFPAAESVQKADRVSLGSIGFGKATLSGGARLQTVQREAHWTIRIDDCEDRGGFSTKEAAFTEIYIVFMDAKTGKQSAASAKVPGDHKQLLQRRVPESGIAAAMEADEAQSLADEAASVTDGKWMRRYWIILDPDQLLKHRSGENRPAEEITPGDSVLLEPYPELLYVWDAWHKDDGNIELTLGEEYEGRSFDVERKLLEFERGS
jgi:hypothetical protein